MIINFNTFNQGGGGGEVKPTSYPTYEQMATYLNTQPIGTIATVASEESISSSPSRYIYTTSENGFEATYGEYKIVASNDYGFFGFTFYKGDQDFGFTPLYENMDGPNTIIRPNCEVTFTVNKYKDGWVFITDEIFSGATQYLNLPFPIRYIKVANGELLQLDYHLDYMSMSEIAILNQNIIKYPSFFNDMDITLRQNGVGYKYSAYQCNSTMADVEAGQPYGINFYAYANGKQSDFMVIVNYNPETKYYQSNSIQTIGGKPTLSYVAQFNFDEGSQQWQFLYSTDALHGWLHAVYHSRWDANAIPLQVIMNKGGYNMIGSAFAGYGQNEAFGNGTIYFKYFDPTEESFMVGKIKVADDQFDSITVVKDITVIPMTQSEYDELAEKENNTLYTLTD